MSGRDERELIEFNARLSARYHAVHAPAGFRRQLRGSLLAAPVAFAARRPSPFGRLAVRSAFAPILVLALLAATGGGAAAATSLPGDPAFALKRGVEQVQVALASDEIARLETLVSQAEARLADLETLTVRHSNVVGAGVDEYLAASARVDEEVTRISALPGSARRDAALAKASAASADHIARLESLQTKLPDAAQHGIQRAIEVQQTVHGKSGNGPGRGGSLPLAPDAPTVQSAPASPTRGGPPSRSPGRP
jgi:hypothetical protein